MKLFEIKPKQLYISIQLANIGNNIKNKRLLHLCILIVAGEHFSSQRANTSPDNQGRIGRKQDAAFCEVVKNEAYGLLSKGQSSD